MPLAEQPDDMLCHMQGGVGRHGLADVVEGAEHLSAGFGKMDVKSNEPKCVFITVIGIAEYWKWVIPASFIRELLIHTMNNYLEYCLKKDRDPFENNIQSQRELLSKW